MWALWDTLKMKEVKIDFIFHRLLSHRSAPPTHTATVFKVCVAENITRKKSVN